MNRSCSFSSTYLPFQLRIDSNLLLECEVPFDLNGDITASSKSKLFMVECFTCNIHCHDSKLLKSFNIEKDRLNSTLADN